MSTVQMSALASSSFYYAFSVFLEWGVIHSVACVTWVGYGDVTDVGVSFSKRKDRCCIRMHTAVFIAN